MNLLVILCSGLRPDYLGCYGNEQIKTPHIDALAESGLIFTQATAESCVTTSARYAMFTGRYGCLDECGPAIPRGLPTLASLASEAGRRTALVTDMYAFWTPVQYRIDPASLPAMQAAQEVKFESGHNLHRGFAETFRIRGNGADPLVLDPGVLTDAAAVCKAESASPDHLQNVHQYLRNRSAWRSPAEQPSARVAQTAADWLRANHEAPFLLWVDFHNPNQPWDPPAPYDAIYYPEYRGSYLPYPGSGSAANLSKDELRHIRALYAGSVSWVDEQVGAVLAALDEPGRRADTAVLFLSDRGVMLGEHGVVGDCSAPPYDEQVRIPMMLVLPGGGSFEVDAPVSTPDVFPTCLEILEITPPEQCQGSSVMGVGGSSKPFREAAICGADGATAIRAHGWKYITYADAREDELYDLSADPHERCNLIERQPEGAEILREEMTAMLTELRSR